MRGFINRLKSFFRGASDDTGGSHLDILENKIGHHFHRRDNLIEALTHSSVLGEPLNGNKDTTYERLEFLGDAVLGLATAEYLMKKFPDENEGELTKKKSLMVSKNVLAKKAEIINLKEHIILSDNAYRDGVHSKESIQSDVIEAIIGAIYIDGGLRAARKFISNFILGTLREDIEHRDHINYKSELQELSQRKYAEYPDYRVKSTRGPEHDKIFFIEVNIDGRVRGKGRGKNKKDAEQMAAKEALANLLVKD
ncbi:MAG TPA: ribonuclease III [Candidatus Krumholzibacteriaceae bacterium]|nr:ribonuclease III [Candidatus Krumholzibacteriaceae bacterium]